MVMTTSAAWTLSPVSGFGELVGDVQADLGHGLAELPTANFLGSPALRTALNYAQQLATAASRSLGLTERRPLRSSQICARIGSDEPGARLAVRAADAGQAGRWLRRASIAASSPA
jgi:hypothetical protein